MLSAILFEQQPDGIVVRDGVLGVVHVAFTPSRGANQLRTGIERPVDPWVGELSG